MKVILTSRVSNIGQIGEVVEVRNGYAKNFLIPSKKAIAFTPNSQKLFEAKRAEFEKANQDDLSQAEKVKAKIANKDVVIIESASDDGRLYGSVNSATIAAKINDNLALKVVSRANVYLAKPIKEIGVYQVRLDLHSDVAVELRLIVTRSESEIDALLKASEKSAKIADDSEKSDKKSKNEEISQENSSETEINEEKPAKKSRKKKSEE